MATPAQLVATVADALGVPSKTVANHDRNLAKAGLRAIGGRGTGAAKMTSLDAGRLLVAVAGSAEVRDSAQSVLVQGQMHGNPKLKRGGPWRLPFLPIPELLALPPKHSLTDAVVALIDSGISGSLVQAAESASGSEVETDTDLNAALAISVTLIDPPLSGRVRISLIEADEEGLPVESAEKQETHSYHQLGDNPFASASNPKIHRVRADLRSEHTFTHRSIMRVAELLRRDASD